MWGAKQVSGITLSLYGTPQTAVSNCNQQHILNIAVRINNVPTGMAITSTMYKLGSGSEQANSCTGGSQTGYIFSCPVTVPAVPNCDAGSYRVGPNYMNFSVTYPNGNATSSKYLSVSFPDITIGSYTCGDHNCESSLGESPGVCCYDCGCASGYCDFQTPQTGSCRQDPASSDLHVSGIAPSRFYTHSPGDSVSFLAQVTNSPVTLSVTGQSCSLGCARSDGQPCSSSCQVSCSKVGSSSTAYNSSCSMTFTIPAYDSLKGYSLFPALNFSVRYSNGSSNTVQKTLSNSFSTINIGAHWCGDNFCDPDETPGTCCYDCGCTGAQYCDTKDIQYRSAGDSCMTNPQIEIDGITSTSFSSTYQQHEINITGHMDSKPSGISLAPSCILGGPNSGFPCYATCDAQNDSQAYRFLCQLIVPSLDYNSSGFFNPSTKKVLFQQNSLNLTFSYNNGSSKAIRGFSSEVPDIIINVIPDCGNEKCEGNVGESKATCCIDCNCGSGYFCYTGKNPNGECLSNSAIDMRIREVQPNPVNCTIFSQGKECSFTDSVKAYPVVMNPPSDLAVIDSYYRILYGGKYTNYTSLNCYQLNQSGNYSCAFTLEPAANKTSPGIENRTLELKVSFSYTSNGALRVLNVSDAFDFSVKRINSEAVASCVQQQQSIDKKLKDLEGDKTLYTVLTVIFLLLTIIFWIMYFVCTAGCTVAYGTCIASCESSWKIPGIIAGIIGGCGLAYVLSQLSSIDGKIKQLQAQKQSICGASTFGQLSDATSSSGSLVYTIGQLYGGVTCAMGASAAIGGLSGGASAGAGGETGTATGGTMTYANAGGTVTVTNTGWQMPNLLSALKAGAKVISVAPKP